jgi:hypothetical protein
MRVPIGIVRRPWHFGLPSRLPLISQRTCRVHGSDVRPAAGPCRRRRPLPWRSVPPEVLEPGRRQCRVDRGAGDRAMTGVVAVVGEGVTAGMAKHVRMRLQFEAGAGRSPLAHAGEAGRRERGWRAKGSSVRPQKPSPPRGRKQGLLRRNGFEILCMETKGWSRGAADMRTKITHTPATSRSGVGCPGE